MNFKIIAILVLVLGIVGTIGGMFWAKEREINRLEQALKDLTEEFAIKEKKYLAAYDELNADFLEAQVETQLERANVEILKTALEKQNLQLNEIKKTKEQIASEFAEWQKRPPEIKYVKEVVTILKDSDDVTSCEFGVNLNKQIAELRYEDL